MLSPRIHEGVQEVLLDVERQASERIDAWSAMDAATVLLEIGEIYGKLCTEQIEIILNEIDVNAPRPHLTGRGAIPHVKQLREDLVRLAGECVHLCVLYAVEPPTGLSPPGEGVEE